MAKTQYSINFQDNETILKFFVRCCEENGFNVSKIISYLDCINNYIAENLEEQDDKKVVPDWLQMEIAEFALYFAENYSEETRERRLQVYGVQDAFVFQLYNEMVDIESERVFKEDYESLSNFEKRKFDRIYNQLVNISGSKTYIFLGVGEDEEESLPPYWFVLNNEMEKEERDEISKYIKEQCMDVYVTKGVIITTIEDEKKHNPRVIGLVFDKKNVVTLTAKQLLSVFATLTEEDMSEVVNKYDKNKELEFMDASFYINPLGNPEVEYNKLGNGLPDRKGVVRNKSSKGNIISFTDIIRK